MREALIPRILLMAVPLELLLLSLRRLGDLREHVSEAIAVLVLTSLVYTIVALAVVRRPDGLSLSGPANAILILAPALLFRITVWPLFPAFTDDLYRYRWEGRLQAAGGNPYQARPADPEWSGLRDETYPRVDGKTVKAIYGPLIELLQHGTYRVAAALSSDPMAQVFWFKLPAALFDLGAIGALYALLGARGLSVERVLLYAWSPLPIFEFWATGHNDAVAVCFVLLALLAAAKERWMLAFVSLALAGCAKIWPFLLFPLFLTAPGATMLRTRVRASLTAVPVVVALCAPFLSDVTANARFLSGFLGGWRNNDSFYGVLLWLTGDVYRAKYAAFALVFTALAVLCAMRLPLERGCLTLLTFTLLVSANCHPWYLTWLISLLAFSPSLALFVWAALMPLGYQVLYGWFELGVWNGSTPLRGYIYAPVYAAFFWELFIRRRVIVFTPENRVKE
jgi:hypothetical protein